MDNLIPQDEELLRIITLLNTTYEGDEAWHGPSLVHTLLDVTPDTAGRRVTPNTHSIAELVFHITSWRIFCVKKMQNDADFDILTPDRDFGALPDKIDPFEWEALQMELSLSQEELINELDKRDTDEFLEDLVPGREYTYYDLLHGIVNHDIYHAGQISLLKKAIAFTHAGRSTYSSENTDYGDSYGSSYDDY